MSCAKRRAVCGPDGIVRSLDAFNVEVNIKPERRIELMTALKMVDPAPPSPEPDFEFIRRGVRYSDNEDLLGLNVPEKEVDWMSKPGEHRMIIKDIIVENFKSYYQRHHLGPLHKNLTMILGPNGSGKSNIIDALLFVFGFKAKRIRSTHLASVIHSQVEECEMAMVELHLQEVKDIDNDSYTTDRNHGFILARSVHRTNLTSTYYFNSKVVSQKWVINLLTRAGIDMAHNRFLILQGEVEAISQMKPVAKHSHDDGMLEYIEDLVGTDRFVDPIIKLTHRVRVLEYKASQYNAACRRHIDQTKDFQHSLLGACAYINEMNKMNSAIGKQVKHNLALGEFEKEEHLRYHLEMMDKLAAFNAELGEAVEAFREYAADEQKALVEMNTRNSEIEEWEHAINEFAVLEMRMVKERERQQAMEERVESEKEAARLALAEAEKLPKRLHMKIENANRELIELTEEQTRSNEIYTSNITRFDERSMQNKSRLNEVNEELTTLFELLAQTKTALREAETELSEMKIYNVEDERRLTEMSNNLTLHLTQYNEENKVINAKSYERANINEKVKNMKALLMPLQNSLHSVENKKREVLFSIDIAEKDHAKHRSQTTDKMHELKNNGLFPGFVGRIGDMASTEDKYDAAISTCYGHLMDLYLVNTNEDMQKGIEFLHQYRLPRHTFICHSYMQTESVVGIDKPADQFPYTRLFDQIHCENAEVRKHIYRAMQNTLIVRDLRVAQNYDAVHKGKYRFITYNGSIMDKNGNITGGGMPSRGRIRIAKEPSHHVVQREDLHKLRVQRDRLKEEYDAAQAQLDNCIAEIKDGRDKIIQLDKELPVLREKCKMVKALVMQMKQRVKEAKEEREKAKDKPKYTEADLTAKRQSVEELRKRFQELEEKIQTITDERDTLEMTNERMFQELVGKNKEKLRVTTENILKIEEEIAKDRAIINSNPLQVAACKGKLEDMKEQDRLVLAGQLRIRNLEAARRDGLSEDECRAQLEQVKAEAAEVDRQYTILVVQKAAAEIRQNDTAVNQVRCNELCNESDQKMDALEAVMSRYRADLEQVEEGWWSPEKLDQDVKYVRIGEANFQEKVDNGALIMAEEVAGILEPRYRESYDSTPIAIIPDSEFNALVNESDCLSRHMESMRISTDTKGITNYCTLISLQMSELTNMNRHRELLKKHRQKMIEFKLARFAEFGEALAYLNATTRMLYQLITHGGDASLKFVEEGRSFDPFDAGVQFSVRPAAKGWKCIENLSGGEKTLASLCFVFAMHHFRPSPLYVMDEIDAALDLNNVRLIANYIKHSERTRNAQFIIVSLRNQMFEVGNRLVGIYKKDGSSDQVIITPFKAEEMTANAKKTIDDKLKEIARQKRGESEESEISDSLSKVEIQSKRRRKLGQISLSQYGMEISKDTPEQTPIRETLSTTEYRRQFKMFRFIGGDDDAESVHDEMAAMSIRGSVEPEPIVVEELEDDFDDGEIKRKPKKRVDPEFDKDDDVNSETSDAPEPVVEDTRRGRRGRAAKNTPGKDKK